MIQMGRPRIHDSDQLLDAAADIAASEGPAALSMAGVAKATGAPSGSVYHLFPTRATLLGELWLRSIRAFQSGYLEELDGEGALQLEVVNTVKSTLVPDGHPFMTGVFTPNHVECNAAELTVIGKIPEKLNGVYLRNTQNPVHQPLGKYHAFDGDGMLHLMSFSNGRCEYRNRFVPTKGFMQEQEAGGALYAGLIDNPKLAQRPGWGARGGLRDTAATDVIVHAGSALATFYQCGEPYRMDARTLAFKGTAPWVDKVMPDGISAHPKVDPQTGELLFFNYAKKAPYMHFGVIDANDTLVHYVPVALPGPRLPHDMAFTKTYAILNDFPLFWDPELLALGKHKVVYRPELPSRYFGYE